MRYTAPSLIFERSTDGSRLEAGGFQPVEAYDVLLANLDPGLVRMPPPEDPLDALVAFDYGLTTYEVAAIMTPNNGTPEPGRGRGRPDRPRRRRRGDPGAAGGRGAVAGGSVRAQAAGRPGPDGAGSRAVD